MRKTTWIISILVFSLIVSFCCCLQGRAVYASDNTGSHACCDTGGDHQKAETKSSGDCDCATHSISKDIKDTNSLQIVHLPFIHEFSGSIESQSHKVNFLSFFKFPSLSSSSPPLFNLYSNYRI